MSCTEEEVVSLVHSFYARIRQDEVLGPIFNGLITDWTSIWPSWWISGRPFCGARHVFQGPLCPSMLRYRV